MTKTKQDKRAMPAAVELDDAALDQAAGGGQQRYTDVPPVGPVATVKDGTSNTLVGIDYRP